MSHDPVSARSRRSVLLGTGGALAAALLAACSSSKSSTTASPTATASPTTSASPTASVSPTASGSPTPSGSPSASASGTGQAITIQDFAFSPTPLTVAPGTKITVTNMDSATHTLTATVSGGGGFDTGAITTGQTATITAPSQPGSYPYTCSIHPNMHGVLNVA